MESFYLWREGIPPGEAIGRDSQNPLHVELWRRLAAAEARKHRQENRRRDSEGRAAAASRKRRR